MRILLLPCETRAREFDAKLLLACHCADSGIPAIVGAKKTMDINLDRYPAGVYVGKSATRRSMHNLLLARARGHRVVLWDEEGLVWASREVYWKTKVDAATLGAAELLIAWGEENAATWQAHPDFPHTPIVAAGNPRIDLLRPELAGYFAEEQRAIEAELGPFILINTNFSRVNHVQAAQNRQLEWLRKHQPHDTRGGFAAHKYSIFHDFRAMIPTLARALPNQRFVIRPHPSERLATWDALAKDLGNVDVRPGGNVIPWLRASLGIIHNGCTTAIEAFVAQRPALAYMPSHSEQYDHPLPNGVSLQITDLPSLLQAVEVMSHSPQTLLARQRASGCEALLAQNLTGLQDATACQRILVALQPLLNDPAARTELRTGLSVSLLGLRRLWRRIERGIPGHGNSAAYLHHMFPPLSLNEVRQQVARFQECLPQLGKLQVTPLQSDVFRVERP